MFKPVEMQKVRIVALSTVAKRLVAELHELGLMEISKVPESEFKTNTPFSDYAEISSRLVQLRSIRNILGKFSKKDSRKKISESKINALDNELKSLVKESSNLKNDIRRKNEELKTIDKLLDFEVDFSTLDTSITDYTLGSIPSHNYAKCLAKLEKHKSDFRLSSKRSKKEMILLFIHPEDIVLDGLLNKFAFVKMSVPKEITTPKKYKSKLLSEIERLKVRLTAVTARLSSLAEDYHKSINDLLNRYNIASQRSQIASNFAFSEKMVVLEGWIVKKEYESFSDQLKKDFGSKAGLFSITVPKDKPPVKLENPKILKTVEFFVKMFSLPNHREFDPTFLFFFTGPLFYGMIMGDVIYGIFSLIVSLLLLHKLKPKGILHFTIKLWMFSAIPAILFGVFFDEWMAMTHVDFFNYLGELVGLSVVIPASFYTGFSRVHNLTQLVGISALVGVINLALGYFLGAINEWNHNRRHAIAKIAWIGVDLGGAVAVMSFMFEIFPAETIGLYSAAILVISAIVVTITEGVIGVLEIPGLAGNILSYTRIAAVGVVGVILAEIINGFFLPDPTSIISIIIMLPLLLIMHGVNTLIVMVEALIQGGRLNIVEFQSKFVHGGGRVFQPFMLSSK